jgi:glycosyltransferase involved in cell wall biosynthesis
VSKVSIIIPSRDEAFLNPTIKDLLEKATGEIEIIAILDGVTSHTVLYVDEPKVKYLQLSEPMGMRHGINIGAQVATGKYLMKLDSHCIMTPGFDEEFQKNIEDDWVVACRRGEVQLPEWQPVDIIADYFYMSSPWTSSQNYMRMTRWITRDKEHRDIPFDETMAFSGSIWFMSKDHFFNRIRMMDEERFGQWSGEPEEIACKTWLGGGKVMLNKNITHYHLRKDKIGRPYSISWGTALLGLQESARYWSSDEWPYRIHDFEWMIDHFWPLPTKEHHCNAERHFWEPDWKEKYYHVSNPSV